MNRVAVLIGVGLAAGAAGMLWADDGHGGGHGGSVKALAVRDVRESLDGADAAATAVEVTLGPGEASAAHRHPGPAFGYVLEGEYEWGIDAEPARVLKAGETFYEPGGCLHRVSKNPGRMPTRVLAWVLHPRGADRLVIPEPAK